MICLALLKNNEVSMILKRMLSYVLYGLIVISTSAFVSLVCYLIYQFIDPNLSNATTVVGMSFTFGIIFWLIHLVITIVNIIDLLEDVLNFIKRNRVNYE